MPRVARKSATAAVSKRSLSVDMAPGFGDGGHEFGAAIGLVDERNAAPTLRQSLEMAIA
jgi:hypothetical protein